MEPSPENRPLADTPRESEGGESFRWRVRLSDKAPEKRTGLLLAAVAAGTLGWVVFRNPIMGIVGFAIIFGSTAEYWLGTQFKVDAKGASARTGFSLVSMDWTDVKRVIWEERGVRLSPLAKAGTLDAFRGVYLRYGDDNREQIERAVERFGGIFGVVGGGPDGRGDGSAGGEGRAGNLPSGDADAGDHRAGDA